MDCPDHKNAELAHCPSCLAEYWKDVAEKKTLRITKLEAMNAKLTKALVCIANIHIVPPMMSEQGMQLMYLTQLARDAFLNKVSTENEEMEEND